MKIHQLSNKDLRQSYKVLIEAIEIESEVRKELEKLKSRVALKGFRLGKTPLNLLEKTHGKAVRGQLLEKMVNEGIEKIYVEHHIKPAARPNVEILKFDETSDLEFRIDLDVLPTIDIPDLSKIKLERLIAKIEISDVNSRIQRLLSEHKQFVDAPKDSAVVLGDVVVIDFRGSVGGKPFEGAEAEDFHLEIGSGMFVEGFETGLMGSKIGDERLLKLTFPKDYRVKNLAGKATEFRVKIKAIKKRANLKADDSFAKSLGFPNLSTLTDNITKQIEAENQAFSRAYLKRCLLDHLATQAKFAAPAGLVEREYKQIWERIKQDMLVHKEATPEELKTLDEPSDLTERKEYRALADRRVRLALLMGELGHRLNVKVTPEEVNQQIMYEAQRNPGQERQVLEFFKKNPAAYESAHAPVYEEKVVDTILTKISITEKSVSLEKLRAALESLDTEPETTIEESTSKPSLSQQAISKKITKTSESKKKILAKKKHKK